MKRFLLAPLALAALLLSTLAASAAPWPVGPHHLTPRERARFEARHRPQRRASFRRPLPAPAPHHSRPPYQR